MNCRIEEHFIYVQTPYKDRGYVKDTLNGVWSQSKKMYRFPKNVRSMRELARTYPALLQNNDFVEEGKLLRTIQDNLLTIKKLEDIPLVDPRLRPYQRVDVEYLQLVMSAGIFNEPRTGKTPTSIILIKKLGTKKNLIVAPASLTKNWEKEFQLWFPECKTFLVKGIRKKRHVIYTEYRHYDGPCVLIISKDTLKSDNCFTWEFDTAFVDEAHYLRNYKTKQSESIFGINATRKYALTGTPTVKEAGDIFGILHFLYPKKFPSYWQFVERYFEVTRNFMGQWEVSQEPKRQRLEEFQELIGLLSVQRKRKEVMAWLPDKQRITHYSEMDDKQRKLYDQMLNDFMSVDEETGEMVDTANVLAQLMRLRQLCLDPRLIGFECVGAKTKSLLEWLDDNREPVVIMSMFTSYFDLVQPDIEALGLKVGRIDGQNGNNEKNKEDFQAGKLDVLLCNIISAGVGHTLDRAETIIFLDKAWNPSDNEQAEDRITPTTEDKNHSHTIISFVVADTVDDRINQILDQKKKLTDYVNEGAREAVHKLMYGKDLVK